MINTEDQKKGSESKSKRWLKKIGIVGILFFVIKGCITTALLILAGQGLWQGCQ
jgi:hypothetical protein